LKAHESAKVVGGGGVTVTKEMARQKGKRARTTVNFSLQAHESAVVVGGGG
jgi:hypothetical protein